jgi:small multidrug resistance family-3 protein
VDDKREGVEADRLDERLELVRHAGEAVAPHDGRAGQSEPRQINLAALFEIGGGYLVWLWLLQQRPILVGVAGMAILALYGLIPTFQPVEHPFGRVYAAYGAVFIALSALWGWWIDGRRPDGLDAIGIAICLAGTTIMMWPRSAP